MEEVDPELVQEICQDTIRVNGTPKSGLGHPEPLRGGGDITWSRHITAHDRIIYDIYDDIVEVYVLAVEGHYNDK